MKRILSFVLCSVLCLSFLASCKNKSVDMEYNEAGELVAENGVVYKYAPVGYEPTSSGKEYGMLNGTLSEKLYTIGDIDPTQWISTEYSGATTTVFYNADIDLPALTDLDPSLCYICEQGALDYAFYVLGSEKNGKVEEEAALINALIAKLNDENTENELWPRGEGAETYDLKMYSEEYPAIYYNLVYVREGAKNFVYDRVTRRCVDVADLIERYFGDAE